MKKVLISTLGESPAVVTEAIDALKREGIEIQEVVLLTTMDSKAQESTNFLIEHVQSYYKGAYAYPITIEAHEDIDTEEAVLEFMETACEKLRSMRKRGDEIYVSIAGGRKTMSVLMSLAVQIYGAKELLHVLISDPDLEEKGKIDKLKRLNDKDKNKVLHPDTDPGLIKLVKMPFIGLFPWISDIVKTLKGESVGTKEVKELLIVNQLIEVETPTEFGKRVLRILEAVESLPDPCPHEPTIHLNKSEPKYKKEIEMMANKLIRRFSFICEIKDTPWREGESKAKINPPENLSVYFRHRKGFTLALNLKTTATTQGQLERCRQEIEKFLDREI